MSADLKLTCGWCGKPERDVRAILKGPSPKHDICDDCALTVVQAFQTEHGINLLVENAVDVTPEGVAVPDCKHENTGWQHHILAVVRLGKKQVVNPQLRCKDCGAEFENPDGPEEWVPINPGEER